MDSKINTRNFLTWQCSASKAENKCMLSVDTSTTMQALGFVLLGLVLLLVVSLMINIIIKR